MRFGFQATVLASALLPLLAGCGVERAIVPSGHAQAVAGIVHGGPNPVVGATVTLYATTTAAYGTGGTVLGIATTGSDGSFAFTSPATCPSGQQAYVTASGGDPGSGTNANYLLVAALGPCFSVSSSTSIWIDEVTTVAAAYALRPFTNVTVSGGVPSVNISAPANNNAASGSCTTASNVTTSCSAAGLPHAFSNALNLANSVSVGGVAPTGTAYTVAPSNPNGSVPAALINSLANAIEACVNSSGGSAGDGTICGNLFLYTTPPITNPMAPTNTFQAMLDVARYPALTSANVTGLYNLSTPIAPYQPTLSAAPADYSLAISYSGISVTGISTGFGNPFAMTLDFNDNVYIGSSTATSSQETAMGSNGEGIWAATVNTTYLNPRGSGTDTLGHVWVAQNGTTAGKFAIQCFLVASGNTCTSAKATSNVFGLAVDRSNNIWFSLNGNANPNLIEVTQSSSWLSQATFANPPKYPAGPHGIAVDSYQNVWTANFFSNPAVTSTIGVFPNTGTASSPAYGGTAITATLAGMNASGIAIDIGGNAWVSTGADGSNSGQGLYKVVPTYSLTNTTQVMSVSPSPAIAESSALPLYNSIDGAGDSWIPDNTNQAIIQYSVANAAANTFFPCYAPSGATTCAASLATPTRTQADSTGSLWTASVSNNRVVQMIGTATPAWPQLSYGYPGVMPQ